MCGCITQQLPSDQICDLYSLQGTLLPALLELVREPYDGLFERRTVSSRVNTG